MSVVKQKELKFIHITKTGGTTIEKLGQKHNIKWGMFHKEYNNWHRPPGEQNQNIIQKYDWFTVVRNPYDRIISELHCRFGNHNREILNKSKNEINEYIRKCINLKDNFHNYKNLYCYGHYNEQHKYLCDNINILKFENLEEDFNKLMIKYNMNIKLQGHHYKMKRKFNIHDLDKETINLINNVYHKDFELFGYQKL